MVDINSFKTTIAGMLPGQYLGDLYNDDLENDSDITALQDFLSKETGHTYTDEEIEILLNYAQDKAGPDATIEKVIDTLFDIIDTDNYGDIDKEDDNLSEELEITEFVVEKLENIADISGNLEAGNNQHVNDLAKLLFGELNNDTREDAILLINAANRAAEDSGGSTIDEIILILFDVDADGEVTLEEAADLDMDRVEEAKTIEQFLDAFWGEDHADKTNGFIYDYFAYNEYGAFDPNTSDYGGLANKLNELSYFNGIDFDSEYISALVAEAGQAGADPAQYISTVLSQYILNGQDLIDKEGNGINNPKDALAKIRENVLAEAANNFEFFYKRQEIAYKNYIRGLSDMGSSLTNNAQTLMDANQLGDLAADVAENT